MERYFNGEEFTFGEIRAAMKFNVCDGDIIPVSMGSSTEIRKMCIRDRVLEVVDEGNRLIRFEYEGIFEEILDRLG